MRKATQNIAGRPAASDPKTGFAPPLSRRPSPVEVPQRARGEPTPFALDVLAKYVLAHTIFAAHEIGLWQRFEDPGCTVRLGEFIHDAALEPRATRGVVDHLVRRDVLERSDEDAYRLTALGRELLDGWYAYIVYFLGGYDRVLAEASGLARGERRYGRDVLRDVGYVARGTEMMSRTSHHGSYAIVLARAAQLAPRRVLDIGCGSASFLIQLVRSCVGSVGVGVDIAPAACQLAGENVRTAAMEERVEIVQADMRSISDVRPDLLGSFEVVTAMMVVHESLHSGEQATITLLAALARLLVPSTGRLLLLDKCTDLLIAGEAPPYLTEFKLAHDLTDQDLCSAATWTRLIAASGLKLTSTRMLAPHTGSILFECQA